jgi:hypothetical protein
MTTTWTITQCDRLTADGFITTAHWTATAADGEYIASIYSTCSFNKPEENVDLTPYDAVTEQDVLVWCWSSGVDKDAIETALAKNIDLQKKSCGIHWCSVVWKINFEELIWHSVKLFKPKVEQLFKLLLVMLKTALSGCLSPLTSK